MIRMPVAGTTHLQPVGPILQRLYDTERLTSRVRESDGGPPMPRPPLGLPRFLTENTAFTRTSRSSHCLRTVAYLLHNRGYWLHQSWRRP
jgi:hypothetical protein